MKHLNRDCQQEMVNKHHVCLVNNNFFEDYLKWERDSESEHFHWKRLTMPLNFKTNVKNELQLYVWLFSGLFKLLNPTIKFTRKLISILNLDGLSSKHCIHRPIQEQNNLIELDLIIKLIQNKDLSLACFSINTVNKFLVELKLINLLNESIFSCKLQYFFF